VCGAALLLTMSKNFVDTPLAVALGSDSAAPRQPTPVRNRVDPGLDRGGYVSIRLVNKL